MNEASDWVGSWTMDGKLSILIFPLLAVGLLIASLKIVKYSEVIITKTRFGSGFVGGTMIAVVTSMPELITEISQAASDKPVNGLGDDIGSNAFSVFLIAVGAVAFIRYSFLNKLEKWTRITLMMSFGLTIALAIILAITRYAGDVDIPGGYMGILPAAFFLFYIVSIFLSYKFGDEDEAEVDVSVASMTAKKASWLFGAWALVVIGFAVMVNIIVNSFQDGLDIPSESAGGVFLAVTTSLPEIIAFLAFMRKRQPAAGIAALVGSHFFNLGIMFFGDVVYDKPYFNHEDMGNHMPLAIITGIMLLLLIGHSLLAVKFKEAFAKRWVYLTIPSVVIATYVLGWAMILAFN